MCDTTATIRADFDHIARVCPDEGWSHSAHYHGFLLGQIPARCAEVLEIGCGTGAFARGLAARADRVLALDLSPEMIAAVRARSAAHPHIDYRVADATAWPFPPERFDAIVSIATLHHLPLEETLARMRLPPRANIA